jgi:WD40 repeat protein
MVAFLAATIVTATCLFGACDRRKQAPAMRSMLGNFGIPRSLAFRPDGKMLSAVGIDGTLTIFDLPAGIENPDGPQGAGPVRCAVFSPDDRALATASSTAAVALHDLVDRKSVPLDDVPAATAGAACVAFSPDGRALAVGHEDGQVTLWDPSRMCRRSTLTGHTQFVAALAFAPNGAMLASSAGDRTTRIWDLRASRERWVITSAGSTLTAMAFAPDGRYLFLGDPTSPVVRVWDMTTGREHAALSGPDGAVVAVAAGPDGNSLAAADYHGGITFWDLATLSVRPTKLRHPGVRALAFDPGGQTLASGGFDGTIHLWNLPVAEGD